MPKTIQTKRCSTCKQSKLISEFHKDRTRKDGYCCRCKACCSKRVKKYNKSKKYKAIRKQYEQSEEGKVAQKRYRQSEKGKAKDKRYNQTKKGKAKRKHYAQSKEGKTAHRKAIVKYRKTTKGKASQQHFHAHHPNQVKAMSAVNSAIRAGKLISPKFLICHYCPKPAKQYHHWHGYEPEHRLDVVPVCGKCHHKCNRKIA